MKREAVNHTKMKRLCRRLDIPVYQGVGILESLWHLTAREAPRGDIGKLSDEDIAMAIDYRGVEADLIEALVLSGWIDRDPVERLVIHDWHTHAEDSVNMRLARGLLHFAGGHPPKITRLSGPERERAHEFYDSCARTGGPCAPPKPKPSPIPIPLPEPTNTGFDARLPDSKNESSMPESKLREYAALREVLTQYRGKRPSDRVVVEIMDAAGGRTEAEVIRCLLYLHNERGFKPGTKHGPRSWAWFKIAVAHYFEEHPEPESLWDTAGERVQ